MTIGEEFVARYKRVVRNNYTQSKNGKCIGCGKKFQHCPHSIGEINSLIAAVRFFEEMKR
jgi:Fe-S-cluster-containing hydrogenase component 2